ncbi:hypothetical protein [uncultured Trichococcus sp.]|uniref:hypothetical protein n=1 Tax=uncultured Trichococcus sp. TaxID=189665 RepID=UPI0029C7008B|nr:hypothetical protein [uncultured Trichococcus sp.]
MNLRIRKEIKLVMLMFFVLIGPNLSFGNMGIDTKQITYLILTIIFFCTYRFRGNALLLGICFQAFYWIIVILLNGLRDITGLKMLLIMFLGYFSANLLYILYIKKYCKDSERYFFLHVMIISVIESIFVLMAYFNSHVWDFSYKYLGYKNTRVFEYINNIDESRRSFGIGTGTGTIASLYFSIFFIVAVLYYKRYKTTFSFLSILIIIIATALLGRTGFYFELLLLLVWGLISLIKKIVNPEIKLNKKIFLNLLPMVIILILIFVNYDQSEKLVNKTLPWLFEFIVNFINGKGLSSNTTDIIMNRMYFLPDDSTTLIFGSSNLGRGTILSFIPSDVGYIRTIFGFGILGLILTYLPIVYLLYFGYKNKKMISGELLLYSSILLLLVNFKELHIIYESNSIIMFCCYFFIIRTKRNSNN